MYMNIFRIMKAVYHMLDPLNEPSSAYEVDHSATLECTTSQENEPSILTGIVIHFRLSNVTRFTLVFRDMHWHIKDKVQNVCTPISLEPGMTEIYEYVLRDGRITPWIMIILSYLGDEFESYIARGIWKKVQVEVRAKF